MDSCVRSPLLHCAFKNCRCNISREMYCSTLYHWQMEIEIYEHVVKEHKTEMEEVMEWIRRKNESGDLFWMKWTYSFYIAAVMQREREHMPLVGPTKDRQMLSYATMLSNSQTICSRMCFVATKYIPMSEAGDNMGMGMVKASIGRELETK